MWPALRAGDVAELSPLETTPAPGEVVVVRAESSIIIHRILRVGPESVVLRGDTCAAEDSPVSPKALVGVVRRIRRGGRILARHEWDRGPSRAARIGVLLMRRLSSRVRRLA